MNILYHLTVPPSPMAACDAVVQEVAALRERVGGQIVHLYPGRAPGTRFPRRWWGMQHLFRLRQLEGQIDLHHVFNPDPFPFDVLRFLRRPVIYTAAAGVRAAQRSSACQLARQAHTLIVSTSAELARLRQWGIQNAELVRPGIDTARFSYTPFSLDRPPTLLMGSAPWTREQFHSKGVDVLLQVVQRAPTLRLVFLWRGVLADEMARRVHSAGLDGCVEVLNEQVDVNAVLARVHAAIVLADGDAIIKTYPHSLLEALAAGKPVLVSRSIPMAAEVEQTGCGVIVEQMDAQHVQAALDMLLRDYAHYQQQTSSFMSDLTIENMTAACGRIYHAARAESMRRRATQSGE